MVGKRIDAESQRRQWEEFRARERARLNSLAQMPDGSGPAWEVAERTPGMTANVFETRLQRGYSPERAATEPVKKRTSARRRWRIERGIEDD